MIYDLKNDFDAEKARIKFASMNEKGQVIELKEKRKKRTISQNAYLHVIFSLYAIEFGYTESEAKTFLKRECGDLMKYEKNGQWFLKGTSDLKKDECQVFIEWLRNFCSLHGLYIPSSEEYLENQTAIDKQINNNKQFIT